MTEVATLEGSVERVHRRPSAIVGRVLSEPERLHQPARHQAVLTSVEADVAAPVVEFSTLI
jgi:hypothetical protein